MARTVTPLTDSKIRTTISNQKKEVNKKALKLADGNGLYLLIDKQGGTYWRFDYTRPIVKTRNTIAIGVYPEITLAQARQYREKFRSELANNQDPSTEKKHEEHRQAFALKNTFEAIAKDFIETEVVAESTSQRNIFIYKYLFQAIGHRPINEITAIELLDLCRLYEKQGKVETARRMRSKASQIFKYAIALGICDRNVAHDIQGIIKPRQSEHNAAITDPKLLGKLVYLSEQYHSRGSISVAYAIKILPHVFTRPGDLRKAKWADIDFVNKQWRFTPQKTANSLILDLIIPLSDQVLKYFQELYKINGNQEFCFASNSSTGFISESSINKALKNLGFINGETTGHGFRATARTLLDEVLKFPIERIEQQLGHQVRDMNGRAYNRTKYLEERIIMMQAWSDYLDSLKESAC
jgi:integrase